MKRRKTLHYNFSDKHKDYIKRTVGSAYNIAEGSIRSGKTTDNVLAFAQDIKHSKDKIFLATASTQPTAKLIIGDCDGFGLEHIFRGQCRWGKYKGNECLIIKGPDTGNREKVVLFCGGSKADSYKKFRGMTIGAWIATEINLHHENTIQEALKRQIKADRKKLYWDLNPDNPGQAIYSEYIDKWAKLATEGKLLGGYNYQAFNIFDNVNIPKKNIEEILSRYEVGSVYYKRDILGQRCAAEGIIFRPIAERRENFIVSSAPDKFRWIECGFDIGGNGSAYAMTCSAMGCDNIIYVLKAEKKQALDLPMDEVGKFAFDFIGYVEQKYKHTIDTVNTDHSDVVINTLNNTRYIFRKTYKPPLEDRPFLLSVLLSQGRLKFVDGECNDLLDELSNVVYAKDRAIILDDGSMQIDTVDSFTYSMCGDWNHLT